MRVFPPTIAALVLVHGAGAREEDPSFNEAIRALEERHGGRLGVAVLDAADERALGHRADERFAMCSTFKLLLAAAVAARVDAGDERWDRLVRYGRGDLLDYSPVTGKEENLENGMTVADLCAATLQWSDNPAANLLLDTLGGPPGLTRFLRETGDPTSRLDRIEPDLNTNLPDDERDTTTPAAMVRTMRVLLTGDVLSADSRQRLKAWLVGNRTGDNRLRAAMDPAWTTGDKTGTGKNGAVNDVAVVWPGTPDPFFVAVYHTGSEVTPEERERIHREVGAVVRAALEK